MHGLLIRKLYSNLFSGMISELQEGIYYRKNQHIGNSFCIMSLRLENQHPIHQVGYSIGNIWFHLRKLKKGFISELPIDSKHRLSGDLTILIGYGKKIFNIAGSRKSPPSNFKFNFNSPNRRLKDCSLVDGSDFKYSNNLTENHLLDDDLILQFIATSEFYTNRAVVEVWKQLHRTNKELGKPCFKITGFYNGFQRPDQRNWLGFHDGVSNLKPQERPFVIKINSRNLSQQDMWLVNGSYLALIKVDIDIEKWQDTKRSEQEKIIGRDKLTGCPIIRIGKSGKLIKDVRCPVRGTTEVIDNGNNYFRDHPPYQRTTGQNVLERSHIGRARPIDRLPIWDKKSLRIFRQGFESFSSSKDDPGFTAGLNFVSFQNTPDRLFRALTYQALVRKQINNELMPSLAGYMSVQSAGIFLVPPVVRNEPFPGASIFFNSKEMNRTNFQNPTSSRTK